MHHGFGKTDSLREAVARMAGNDIFFADGVVSRLESFGCQLQESDSWAIGFSVQKVLNNIKNECNVSKIPSGLLQIAVDMSAGDFLFNQKGTGQLKGFEFETAVKQIQEGDTNVVFATDGSATPEQRLDMLVSYLMNYGKSQFITYRRMKW